jgi:hypothetical protein
LKTSPTDLTRLAEKAGGVFPRARVETLLMHGRPALAAHGSSEMPVWGPIFKGLEPKDALVDIRIANVVAYVEALQAK